MSKELITVVTVCFNAGQTIAKTMQSVLNQTYRTYSGAYPFTFRQLIRV